MSTVQAIYSIHSIQSISTNELNDQLENLIDEYRAHMGDADQTILRGIMEKIESFLEKNKALIMEQCAMNGYSNTSKDWTEHYATFFNAALNIIHEDLSQPDHFDPYFLNEQITQLHFLMADPRP